MYKVLTILLMVWLMGMGLINNSSAGEDKSLKITGQDVAPYIRDTKSQAPGIQTTDIHTGKPINKNVYEDYNGKRIYFCCELHKKPFREDPETYFKQFQDKGISLEDAPATK